MTTPIRKFRRKPVVVEAVQWDGSKEAKRIIASWGGSLVTEYDTGSVVVRFPDGKCYWFSKELLAAQFDPLPEEGKPIQVAYPTGKPVFQTGGNL